MIIKFQLIRAYHCTYLAELQRPPGKASKSQALKLLILANGDQFNLMSLKELNYGIGSLF